MPAAANDPLLAAFAALRDAQGLGKALEQTGARRDGRAGTRRRDATVSASRLCQYAGRPPGHVDLAIERALRGSPGARGVYARALAANARACSDLAAAAAAARVMFRTLGPHQLELTDTGRIVWLTLCLDEALTQAAAIFARDSAEFSYALEALGADGEILRLVLGPAVNGVVQIPLDPRRREMARLQALLERADTAVFLL